MQLKQRRVGGSGICVASYHTHTSQRRGILCPMYNTLAQWTSGFRVQSLGIKHNTTAEHGWSTVDACSYSYCETMKNTIQSSHGTDRNLFELRVHTFTVPTCAMMMVTDIFMLHASTPVPEELRRKHTLGVLLLILGTSDRRYTCGHIFLMRNSRASSCIFHICLLVVNV